MLKSPLLVLALATCVTTSGQTISYSYNDLGSRLTNLEYLATLMQLSWPTSAAGHGFAEHRGLGSGHLGPHAWSGRAR